MSSISRGWRLSTGGQLNLGLTVIGWMWPAETFAWGHGLGLPRLPALAASSVL